MTEVWRRYLAVAQIAGGVAGFLGLRVWQVLNAGGLWPVAGLVAALYFALCIVAGLLLWRRHPAGVPLSLAIQLPQVLVVIGPETNLLLLAGPYLRALVPGSGFSVGIGAGGLCDASLLTGPIAGHVGSSLDLGFRQYLVRGEEFRAYGINVLALVGAWKLARVWLAEPVTLETPAATVADISARVV